MHATAHDTERMIEAPASRREVDFQSEADVRYWLTYFGVRDYALWQAILAVGSDPQAISRHLAGIAAPRGH